MSESMEEIVTRLMGRAFTPTRDPRSEEYMRGCIAALKFRVGAVSIRSPYQLGTAQFDAWRAGVDEGHSIWRREGEPRA